MNKSEFFRKIILDYKLREQHDERFYEILSLLRNMANNLNQIAEEIRHCDNIQKRMDKIKKYELHQKLKEERQKVEQQKKSKTKNKYRNR